LAPIRDVATASDDIVYAVFAALTHRLDSDIETTLRVLAEALDTLDGQTARFWAEYTEAGLGEGCTREIWRNIMTTMPYKYPSQLRLMGREEGRLEGEAAALLIFLEGRGIELTFAERQRVERCTDEQLMSTWLSRAGTAANAEELFAAP
jgi:hypothetical protein